MIVKIQKAGSSFKGLANYLTEQKERVAWTHSLSCANDDVLSAVHEMYSTFSQADLLKEQAGVRAGGSIVDKPVKHISLNWHPDEQPTRDEMIAAAEAFLNYMGWEEHQALLVAHNDKAHMHVHIELNRVHPETGKVLDDSFERRRASDWGLSYERDHGNVYCSQRLLEHDERTPSPSRGTWEQLREAEAKYVRDEIASFERLDEDYFKREDKTEAIHGREWELLKSHQRAEREGFFAEGKILFKELRNEVHGEVRERYREIWGEYYAACREGISVEDAQAWKADIVALQRHMFETLKEQAFAELRSSRDEEYKQLLSDQKDVRHELHRAQDAGLVSYDLLDLVGRDLETSPHLRQSEAANQNDNAAEKLEENEAGGDMPEPSFDGANDNTARIKSGEDALGSIGLGLIGGIASLGERLFDGFFGDSAGRMNRLPPAPAPDSDARARRDALRFQRIEEAIEAARADRAREQGEEYWRDRKRSRD
jgi:hypothetical protein